MKMNPKDYAEEYKNQEKLTASYATPPDGTYVFVNVGVNRLRFRSGDKVMNKINFNANILKVMDAHDKKGNKVDAEEFVGRNTSFALWSDWTRNGRPDQKTMAIMASLGLACGMAEEWDPDVDADLVRVTTGVPFIVKFDTRERELDNGEKRADIVPREFKMLATDARKKITAAPDWKSIIGDPADRMGELKDYSQKKDDDKKGSTSSKADKKEHSADDDPFKGLD